MKRNVMYRGVAMWVMPLEKKMRELYGVGGRMINY